MPPKPNARTWNDVQTAIATVAIVATLGLWNLFAEPPNLETQPEEPLLSPTEPPAASAPTSIPQVKIMFTQIVPQSTVSQQVVNNLQEQKKKKKNKDNNVSGGGSVTQTKTS